MINIDSKIEEYLSKKGFTLKQQPKIISDTNNIVYECYTNKGVVTFKLLTDIDIDLEFVAQCSKKLSQKILVQKIIDVDTSLTLFDYPVMIADFIPGKDMAHLLENDRITKSQEKEFINFLAKTIENINTLKLPKIGYGTYKFNQDLNLSYNEGLQKSLKKYTEKFTCLLPQNNEWFEVKQIMQECFDKIIIPVEKQYAVVSLDMNLKNFLYTEDRKFCLFNLPILGYCDIVAGWGEMSSQLIGGDLYELFKDKIKSKIDPSRFEYLEDRWVFHETLGLLGSLSAASSNVPEKVMTARCWGYKAIFYKQIFQNIAYLKNSLDRFS